MSKQNEKVRSRKPSTINPTDLAANAKASESSEPKKPIHPYEKAGFTRGLEWGAISIISNALQPKKPEQVSESTEDSILSGLAQPNRSALEKFADRTPEEKERFFLLFSKLLKDQVKLMERKPN
jgi:hypothetical protein